MATSIPEEDARTDSLTAGRTRTAGEDQRQHAEDEGQRGHHDRAEAQVCGQDHGRQRIAALFDLVLGELHDQDGVLGHQSHQHHQSDLEVDVVLQSADPVSEVGADAGDGQRQDHRHGDQPALVLRRQEQEDEEEGQPQNVARLSADVLLLIGKSAPLDADRRRQVAACDLFA